MQACLSRRVLSSGTASRPCSETKPGAILQDVIFFLLFPFEWFLMIMPPYIYDKQNACTERTRSLIPELDGKALHVLRTYIQKNLDTLSSGMKSMRRLLEYWYASDAWELTRGNVTRPEGHWGQRTVRDGQFRLGSREDGHFGVVRCNLPFSLSYPSLLLDKHSRTPLRFVQLCGETKDRSNLKRSWKSKALIKHELVSFLPYILQSPPPPSLILPVHLLQEPTWCFYSSS